MVIVLGLTFKKQVANEDLFQEAALRHWQENPTYEAFSPLPIYSGPLKGSFLTVLSDAVFTCFRLLKPGGAVVVNVLEPSSVPFYQWLNFLKACLHMFGILFHTHHSQRTGQSKTRSFKSLSISTYYFGSHIEDGHCWGSLIHILWTFVNFFFVFDLRTFVNLEYICRVIDVNQLWLRDLESSRLMIIQNICRLSLIDRISTSYECYVKKFSLCLEPSFTFDNYKFPANGWAKSLASKYMIELCDLTAYGLGNWLSYASLYF